MHKLNITNSNKKKIRGLKRKTTKMLKNIESSIKDFSDDYKTDGSMFRHCHLPVAQSFIDSNNTQKSIRRLCIQSMINAAKEIMNLRQEGYRVVVLIYLPNIFFSQIVVFYGNEYYSTFFDRNNDHQKWIPLDSNRSIVKEWQLDLPDNFSIKGYKEEINDEDSSFSGEIRAIGEL